MPANEVSGVMQELLKADGLSLHELSDSAGVRFLSLPGGYRKLVTKPSDLTCRFTRYSDPTRALTVSDVELLRNPAAEPAPFEENGQYAAVVLQFSLSSSCYATMLLRELMMSSTEKHHHAALLAKHMDSVDAVNVSAADVHKRNSPAPQL
jgi:tRNA pseudouridine13 synthase